jgi:hypothetical protein
MRLHLISNNAGLFREATIQVSTVELVSGEYETALMTEGGVEPIEQYDTMADAVSGHQYWCRHYNTYNDL